MNHRIHANGNYNKFGNSKVIKNEFVNYMDFT